MTPLEHVKSIYDFAKAEISRMDVDNHLSETAICLAVDEFDEDLERFFQKIMEIDK